jgi:tricarballylate dehydrogenase
MKKIVIAGSGNAALCAGIAALESGADVLIVEKAAANEAGGNSRYTAGAMRFPYQSRDELLPLLRDPASPTLDRTDFGSYPRKQFADDLAAFNDGDPLNNLQQILVNDSYDTMLWLSRHNIGFDPIYSRQTFQRDGRYVFWGGLVLEAQGEGVGLIEAEMREFLRLGGQIQYEFECRELVTDDTGVRGVICMSTEGLVTVDADAVVLACGGFEASADLRRKYMGEKWVKAKVRGTRHNTGTGIEMASAVGAEMCGRSDGCHAVPMDLHMPDFGNTELPFIERKNYRKICYFLGIMLNANGERFVDEGENFRNYTYAQFGRKILDQPQGFAWQLFDSKVDDLLYDEYRTAEASSVEADTLSELASKLAGVDTDKALNTLQNFNRAVNPANAFDPTILDGRCTTGLPVDKTNWANALDKPPFKAFPVTCGITFTYAGLRVDNSATVLDCDGKKISGLYACGELIGGIFSAGYPGGSGLTSGAVFGRIAGRTAAQRVL